jgi:hypothetical protein
LDSCRDAAANGDAGEREKTGGVGDGRKGKADKRDPLVSCPGWKGGGASRRAAVMGWAGLCAWERERKGERELGSGLLGWWACGLVGVLGFSN